VVGRWGHCHGVIQWALSVAWSPCVYVSDSGPLPLNSMTTGCVFGMTHWPWRFWLQFMPKCWNSFNKLCGQTLKAEITQWCPPIIFTYNIFTVYQKWKEELTKFVSIDTHGSNFWIWNFVPSKILFQYKVQWSVVIEIIRLNYQGSSPKITSYLTGLFVYSYINHSNFRYGRNPMYCYFPCYLSWISTIIVLSGPSGHYLC